MGSVSCQHCIMLWITRKTYGGCTSTVQDSPGNKKETKKPKKDKNRKWNKNRNFEQKRFRITQSFRPYQAIWSSVPHALGDFALPKQRKVPPSWKKHILMREMFVKVASGGKNWMAKYTIANTEIKQFSDRFNSVAWRVIIRFTSDP